jgi:RNase adapter protein RapZ
MNLHITSFGYRHGTVDADVVVDCREIWNPHNDLKLRQMTGLNARVSDRVLNTSRAQNILGGITGRIIKDLEHGTEELSIAFGCTGGHHRSVALAQELYKAWRRADGVKATVYHRELKGGGA